MLVIITTDAIIVIDVLNREVLYESGQSTLVMSQFY
jgi:hypothetical protein